MPQMSTSQRDTRTWRISPQYRLSRRTARDGGSLHLFDPRVESDALDVAKLNSAATAARYHLRAGDKRGLQSSLEILDILSVLLKRGVGIERNK